MTRRCVLIVLLQVAFVPAVWASGEQGAERGDMITIDTGSYTFNAVERGDPSGEPVILLHGFPETSAMWRRLQDLLAEDGYYTLAPDQRGYSPGARPRRIRDYDIELLADDVVAIADSRGIASFHLVGHDWGSAVAWYVAWKYPQRIRSLTAMSVPHLEAFRIALTTDPLQYEASSYMRLFRWRVLPELFLRSRNLRRMRAIWEESTDEEIARYVEVFSQRGALRAALNWYRANYRSLTGSAVALCAVKVPTLFLWGTRDPAILRTGAELNEEYVSRSYSEVFLDAGHWLMQESFDEVSARILEHLNRWRLSGAE